LNSAANGENRAADLMRRAGAAVFTPLFAVPAGVLLICVTIASDSSLERPAHHGDRPIHSGALLRRSERLSMAAARLLAFTRAHCADEVGAVR
jgi:hypothetical protein